MLTRWDDQIQFLRFSEDGCDRITVKIKTNKNDHDQDKTDLPLALVADVMGFGGSDD